MSAALYPEKSIKMGFSADVQLQLFGFGEAVSLVIYWLAHPATCDGSK
jgi:hypothetical protein